MYRRTERVGRVDLAALVETAADLERRSPRLLGREEIEVVAGGLNVAGLGLGGPGLGDLGTAGMFPPPSPPFLE